MSKRFEDVSAPQLVGLLQAYDRFGLLLEIGDEGVNTAFTARWASSDEVVEFHTVPGLWSEPELRELLADAYGQTSSPNRAIAA